MFIFVYKLKKNNYFYQYCYYFTSLNYITFLLLSLLSTNIYDFNIHEYFFLELKNKIDIFQKKKKLRTKIK